MISAATSELSKPLQCQKYLNNNWLSSVGRYNKKITYLLVGMEREQLTWTHALSLRRRKILKFVKFYYKM